MKDDAIFGVPYRQWAWLSQSAERTEATTDVNLINKFSYAPKVAWTIKLGVSRKMLKNKHIGQM